MRAGNGEVQQAVLSWVQQQDPGTEIHYARLAEKLGFSSNSVNTVLVAISRETPPLVDRANRRGFYRVAERKPAAPDGRMPAGSLLEVVGYLKTGRAMLRDGAGDIWTADRL